MALLAAASASGVASHAMRIRLLGVIFISRNAIPSNVDKVIRRDCIKIRCDFRKERSLQDLPINTQSGRPDCQAPGLKE